MSPDLTWVEVDLAAIRSNVRRMKALAATRLMAVVKANAYGHGAEAVAKAAAEAGADWLGVARASEGLALREAGLELPILVMGYTAPGQAAAAIGHDLSLAVYDREAAEAYAALARGLNRAARLHLKVDTGMGRLGVRPGDAVDFARSLRAIDGIEVEGLFTHFAGADLADLTSARRQVESFDAVVRAVDRPALVHASNSAGALVLPEARYDLVRAGIALYGLAPSGDVPCPPGFEPALSWKASVTQVKELPAGHGISYGSEYVTRAAERVAVVGVGYADGFRRHRPGQGANEVLLGGRRAPVRGRVCMDQIIVSAAEAPGVRVGDEVVLIGRQGEARLSAEDVALRWGTINYDVVSGIMGRVPRAYV